MRPGITFDTGALIALERRDTRMRRVVDVARESAIPVTVPAVVLIEWWRDNPGQLIVLKKLAVDPTTARHAMAAGVATAKVGATAIDAAVMASAASRGDVVYTSDVKDLERLRDHFPTVRVFRA